MKKIIIPLPNHDYDPTEVAVSFIFLKRAGFQVVVATPRGEVASADEFMTTGKGLGILKRILMADDNGLNAYKSMISTSEYLHPIKYSSIEEKDYDGIVLPGGHTKGMREYLESEILQKKITEFYKANKPIGAICHGVVLLSRSKIDHQSIIKDHRVTALTKVQELTAFNLTRLWLNDYYLTYNITVEDEVKSNLLNPDQFLYGPKAGSILLLPFLKRDEPNNYSNGFCVVDKNIVTARWPGDAHLFIQKFIEMFK